MKVGQIVDAWNHLKVLALVGGLDAKTNYRIVKGLRVCEQEFKDYEQSRVAAVRKHGAADDKGTIKVPPENMKAWSEEMTILRQEDVELPQFPIDLPGSATGLTPAAILALDDTFIRVKE